MKQSKRYTEEFKVQMIELVKMGRSPKDLAAEFGCHVTSIGDWVRQSNQIPKGGESLSIDERKELIMLRKRLKQVEMERDILAKATAWFARQGVQ